MEVLVATLRRRISKEDWLMQNILKVLPKYGGISQSLRK
jgi:hypothetical protein